MTVFKTFLKILNKNKFIVIMYTVILLVFGISNMQTSDNNMSFVSSKPDVLIINKDTNNSFTNNLIKYIEDNSNIKDIDNEEEKINDALFYRDLNYIIYIPENFSKDFIEGKNPTIEVKSTGDYQSSLEEMILKRYLNVASSYLNFTDSEDVLIEKINNTLSIGVDVELTSKVDKTSLDKATYYYNFASYSILACLILIISLVLSSFNSLVIRKRIIISYTDYKKHNRLLLLSNCCYSIVLWLFYVVISFVIVGKIMFSVYGLIYMINSLFLTLCATTIAFLIGTLVNNKDAISGIVNVIALGSSFLCGAFVPVDFLPDSVLKFAHVLPTYYYINSNNLLKTLEVINFTSIKPILINMLIIICFSIMFMIITNIVSKYKRKIG